MAAELRTAAQAGNPYAQMKLTGFDFFREFGAMQMSPGLLSQMKAYCEEVGLDFAEIARGYGFDQRGGRAPLLTMDPEEFKAEMARILNEGDLDPDEDAERIYDQMGLSEVRSKYEEMEAKVARLEQQVKNLKGQVAGRAGLGVAADRGIFPDVAPRKTTPRLTRAQAVAALRDAAEGSLQVQIWSPERGGWVAQVGTDPHQPMVSIFGDSDRRSGVSGGAIIYDEATQINVCGRCQQTWSSNLVDCPHCSGAQGAPQQRREWA